MLGFSVRAYEVPAEYGYVERDSVELHLSASEAHDRHHGAEVYLFGSDADAVFAAWSASGVKVAIDPHDTDYGLREFAFVERDGRRTGSARHSPRPDAAPADRERHLCGTVERAYFRAASWMRLPHVSSKTALVTGPISSGSWVNRTRRARSRLCSARMSSTADDVVLFGQSPTRPNERPPVLVRIGTFLAQLLTNLRVRLQTERADESAPRHVSV